MVAPGTAAPVGSVTVPMTFLVTVCAQTTPHRRTRAQSTCAVRLAVISYLPLAKLPRCAYTPPKIRRTPPLGKRPTDPRSRLLPENSLTNSRRSGKRPAFSECRLQVLVGFRNVRDQHLRAVPLQLSREPERQRTKLDRSEKRRSEK